MSGGEMFCTCADWDTQIAIVNGPISLQTIRSGGTYRYPGKVFEFCPWCGAKLSERVLGMRTVVDPTIPPDTVEFRDQSGNLLGTITGLAIEYNVEFNAVHGKPPARHQPSGTNLFDAAQAEAMVRYMAEGLPVDTEEAPSTLELAFAKEPERSIVDAALKKIGSGDDGGTEHG